MLHVLHSLDTVQSWKVIFEKVNWEIMTQLNFNIPHHDNSGEIVPSKGFEKITEVGVMKDFKSAVENSSSSPHRMLCLYKPLSSSHNLTLNFDYFKSAYISWYIVTVCWQYWVK